VVVIETFLLPARLLSGSERTAPNRRRVTSYEEVPRNASAMDSESRVQRRHQNQSLQTRDAWLSTTPEPGYAIASKVWMHVIYI